MNYSDICRYNSLDNSEHIFSIYTQFNRRENLKKVQSFRIGITIRDNDFAQTIEAFLQLLYHGYRWDIKYPTKEEIIELFNRSAAGIYWVYQNGLQYQTDWDAAEYLKDPTVYMNEELDKVLETFHQWGNGDMGILDISDPCYPYLFVV